jgi:hypothetical protein
MNYLITVLCLFIFSNQVVAQEQDIVIDTHFSGGNIIVEGSNFPSTTYYAIRNGRNVISLRPDLRDTEGNWFYWYFRVRGAAGQTLRFQFPGRHVGPFGPAYSNDGGASWEWLYGYPEENDRSFSYHFDLNENEVRFSVGMPYLQSDFDEFISQHKENPYLTLDTLTTSAKSRRIEKLLIRSPEQAPKYKVLLTARHHAVEMMASYVLEGIIASLLSEDDRDLGWLRENVEFFIVPFMDKDGVEDGDQGKNRRPRDHVLDYEGESIYSSTAALREQIPSWSERKLKIVLDLHCPYLRNTNGGWNELIYFVGPPDKTVEKEMLEFATILSANLRGELIFQSDNFLPFGQDWNVAEDYIDKGLPVHHWTSTIEGILLSSILEIPYSMHEGQQVTPQNLRLFGKDLAIAMAKYLQRL